MKRLLGLTGLFVLVGVLAWLWQPVSQQPTNLSFAPAGAGELGVPRGESLKLPASLLGTPVTPVNIDLTTLQRINEAEQTNPLPQTWHENGIESPLTSLEWQAAQDHAQALPPDPNIQDATQNLGGNLTQLAAFAGLDINNCCGAGPPSVPPDPDLAVGENHVIAVVNTGFEIYDTNGNNVLGPFSFATFFNNVPGCNGADNGGNASSSLFDPNVLYDEEAERFIIAIDRIRVNGSGQAVDGSFYCIAVSQTSNPVSWSQYAFAMDGSAVGDVWMDYPSAGVGDNAIYMGGNLFGTTSSPSPNIYIESRVWAFNKTQMYAGLATNLAETTTNSDFTPQPLHLHGFQQGTWPSANEPHYFFTLRDNANGGIHAIYSWDNPFSNPTLDFVGTVDLNVATGVGVGMPIPSLQNGGTPIAANDWRPLDFEYANGSAWTATTVSCNPGGGTVNCLRWAEINPATATVVQAGVYGNNGQYRSFPDVAVNSCGQMAMGYTKSSSATFPSVWVASRNIGETNGAITGEQLLKAGELPYTAFDTPNPGLGGRRWGDYSGMTIAPDGQTFWYIGEYSKNTGNANGRWGTYIGAYQDAICNGFAVTSTLFLPLLFNQFTPPPPPPKAGLWDGRPVAIDFYVTPDQGNVRAFSLEIQVNGCDAGGYRITQPAFAPISNNMFSYAPPIVVTGTFADDVLGNGTVGLDNLNIPGCGVVSTSEPSTWIADWQNDSQPSRPDRLRIPVVLVEGVTGRTMPNLIIEPLD